jgi:O-succinylbenzoic acid--CoA ligase
MFVDFEHLNLHSLRENYAQDAYFSSVLDFIESFLVSDSFISYTSGSTGEPKALNIDKNRALASADLSNRFFRITNLTHFVLSLDIKYIGSKMLLIRAQQAFAKVEVVRPSLNFYTEVKIPFIDFISLTPIHVNHVLENYPVFFNKVKTCLIGASGVSKVLEDKIRNQNLKTVFYESFAMTETISHFALRNISNHEEHFECLDGFEVNVNDKGCLEVYHPVVLPEKVVTNDIVKCIDSSRFIFLGRKDNLINSGGLKISPEKLEKEWSLFLPFKFILAGEEDAILGQRIVMILQPDYIMSTSLILELFQANSIAVKFIPKEFYLAKTWYETESLKPLRMEIIKHKVLLSELS